MAVAALSDRPDKEKSSSKSKVASLQDPDEDMRTVARKHMSNEAGGSSVKALHDLNPAFFLVDLGDGKR